MIASVIINVANSNVDQQFDYLVPDAMQDIIKVGSRVKVEFGGGNRTIMGYVFDIKEQTDYTGKLKEIVELLDLEPLITEKQFQLAKYIQYDSLSPLVRILNMMIPSALRLKTVKYLNAKNLNDIDAEIAMLFGGKTTIEYTNRLLKYSYKISKEREKGNIEITYDALQNAKEKMIHKYQIDMDVYFTMNYRPSDYVKDVLRRLAEEVPLTKNEIIDNYDISLYMVNSLIKRGILKKVSEKTSYCFFKISFC